MSVTGRLARLAEMKIIMHFQNRRWKEIQKH
jgi:hypothetical protein